MVIPLAQLQSKQNAKKYYLISLEAVAFGQHGRGVPYIDYANHCILVLDAPSTQEASHDYLYPELTDGFISVSLRFSPQLTNSEEVFCLCERSTTVLFDSLKVCENSFLRLKLVNKRWWIVRKFYSRIWSAGTLDRYVRVFSVKTFPITLNDNTIINVNSQLFLRKETLARICHKNGIHLLGDPSGFTSGCLWQS